MPVWKRPSPALVIALLALFVSLSGIGVAATGGTFLLGESNTADQPTLLTGTVPGNGQLRVGNASTAASSDGLFGKVSATSGAANSAGVRGVNTSSDPSASGVVGKNTGGGPGLSAIVNSGVPPLSVNSSTKVAGLNADQLDGIDSSGFLTPSLSFAEVAAEITTNPGAYASDPGSPGPTLTVVVPDAGGGQGFIEVSAQVESNGSQSAIGLFDVTGGGETFVSGQDTVCSDNTIPASLPGSLFMTDDGTPGTFATPIGFDGFDCVPTVGPPSPVLLHVTAGTRTFQLEYADCLCGGTPTVKNRRLWIAPQRTS
jgi:hypothetical protein